MTDLWAGIDCDWRAGGSMAPSAAALDLAGRLVAATRAAGFPPHAARHGYWPTVCLIWDDGRVEVEVFDGRYELYFLPGGEAGQQFTVAKYAAETPGILVPEIRKAREGRTDGHEVSARMIDQRQRNRIIEVLEVLAEGNEAARIIGPAGYFEWFYDFLPYRDRGLHLANSAIIGAEREALAALGDLLDEACDDTPPLVDEAELIASGWPERIGPVAKAALDLMQRRGRFREDVEEAEPTG